MTTYQEREQKSISVLSDDGRMVTVKWSKIDGVFLEIQGRHELLTVGPLRENAVSVLQAALNEARSTVFPD